MIDIDLYKKHIIGILDDCIKQNKQEQRHKEDQIRIHGIVRPSHHTDIGKDLIKRAPESEEYHCCNDRYNEQHTCHANGLFRQPIFLSFCQDHDKSR